MISFGADVVAAAGEAHLAWQGYQRCADMLAPPWCPDTGGCEVALLLHTLHLANGALNRLGSFPQTSS